MPTQLSHLEMLEAESIHIIREVAAEFERPVLLFSGGKDSAVMLRLAEKAFWPARIPFPVMHVDTGHNFDEVLEFRDRRVAERASRSRPGCRQDHHGDDTDHDHGDRGVGAREMEILVREEEADHAHDGQDTHVHRKDGSGVDRAGRDPRHEAGALPLELPGPRVPDGAAWHSADLE